MNENTIKQYYWIKPHSYRLWVFMVINLLSKIVQIFFTNKTNPLWNKTCYSKSNRDLRAFLFFVFFNGEWPFTDLFDTKWSIVVKILHHKSVDVTWVSTPVDVAARMDRASCQQATTRIFVWKHQKAPEAWNLQWFINYFKAFPRTLVTIIA